jgi:hypothetical protein
MAGLGAVLVFETDGVELQSGAFSSRCIIVKGVPVFNTSIYKRKQGNTPAPCYYYQFAYDE